MFFSADAGKIGRNAHMGKKIVKRSKPAFVRIFLISMIFVGVLAVIRKLMTICDTRELSRDRQTSSVGDYVLEAKNRVVYARVKSNPEIDPATSWASYWNLPLEKISLVQMKYGASMVYAGMSQDRKGRLFNVKVPPIEFPGILTLKPLATCVAYHSGNAITCEGTKMSLGSGGEEDMGANLINGFKLLIKIEWIDTAAKREVKMTGSIQVDLSLPSSLQTVVPKIVFKRIGNAAMSGAMDILLNGFARSFKEDYERWSVDEEYRKKKASTRVVAVSV